jgi:hypothetical protein
MCHMTYLRDLFERYRQGDVVARALTRAVAAVDPGLQLSFVFKPEDAEKLKANADAADVSPQAVVVVPGEVTLGLLHPSAVAARLRAVADELDAAVLRSVDLEYAERTKPRAAAEPPPAAPAAALPPQ